MDKIKQYLYYILIGIISFIALVFLPMLGSTVGMAWNLPTTTAGWAIWIITKLIVSVLNMLIFYCFMEQGKLNIKDNEKYIEALKILEMDDTDKDNVPRSPKKWQRSQYGHKGITILMGTLFSTFALTQAILTYDVVSLLTYIFVISLGLVFGILQMKTAELYWTDEFWRYAQTKIKHTEVINNDQTE